MSRKNNHDFYLTKPVEIPSCYWELFVKSKISFDPATLRLPLDLRRPVDLLPVQPSLLQTTDPYEPLLVDGEL